MYTGVVGTRVKEQKDWGRALLDGEGLTKVCGDPYLGKALSDDAAATTSALLDFFRIKDNAKEKARVRDGSEKYEKGVICGCAT